MNAKNTDGETPLHIASEQDDLATIIALMHRKECNLNSLKENGDTPLHTACKHGRHSTVEFLVADQRCQINTQNREGETPLYIALKNGYLSIAEVLLSRKECDFNTDIDTLLHTVCKHGSLSTVKFLFDDQRCNPCISNTSKHTALHAASKHGHQDITKFLLSRMEDDINTPDEDGNTPLHTICKHGPHTIVEFLVADQRCQLNTQNRKGETPLHLASEFGSLSTVKVLLNRKECQLNTKNWEGETPLHIASEYGHLDTVKVRVSRKECNLNVSDVKGNTPLHTACEHGHHTTVEFLVADLRCQVNTQNRKGETPLHLASQYGCLDTVKVLTSRNECELNIPDENGITPLHTACKHGHHSTVEFLVADQKCQLNTQNRDGKTPLHIASQHGYMPTVKALMSCKDCHLNIPDEKGNTPLHTACIHDSHSTVESLVAETAAHSASKPIDRDRFDALVSFEHCDYYISDESGNVVLHTAHKYAGGPHSIVEFLVADQRSQLNSQNSELNTPLHIACHMKALRIIRLLLDRKCSTNIPNKKGETAQEIPLNEDGDCLLPIACQWGDAAIVRYLITDEGCNQNIANASGNTPLHTVTKNDQLDIVKVLLSRKECDLNIAGEGGDTPLHSACKYGHHSTVEFLVADQRCQLNTQNSEMNTPLHIACHMKASSIIRLLLDRKCSIIIPNKKGQTAQEIPLNEDGDCLLHLACQWGDVDMITYIVTEKMCDPNILNKDLLTPLLATIKHGEASVATALLQHAQCDLSLRDQDGNTALHLACIRGQTHSGMVKVAKHLIISADPLLVNNAGQTPIELTTNYELIQAISHFTKCKTKHSVQTYINLFIVGNPETGKSTLVKAVCKEANTLWKIVPKVFRRVKNVQPHTAGIIPTAFRSKTFGNTVLYDLAGQIEYYTSHAAVIQTTVISTPPAFIIVVNISESEEKISETLRYWWSFINNHAARASAPPQVILVGSHADKVKARGGNVQEKMSQMSSLLKRLPTSFCFAGQVALDCRDPASSKLSIFCSLVNCSCFELRQTADVDLRCHVLYAFLLDKFQGKVVCTASDIATIIQESDALLPQNPDGLIPLISTLREKGLLLLVSDSGSIEHSWVILQKQVLLGEINGAIFAPKDFSEHKDLSSSTGVVPASKLRCTFPHYNPTMIGKFLLHLEFCFKIHDLETLELLKDEVVHEENMSQSLSEEYYFFPALVSVENPLQVWKRDDVLISQCGWFYQCSRHDQFLTTQFLHVLILRLAFSFALQYDPGDSHEKSLALHRRCSVWKCGIGWLNRVPIETVVEVGLLNQSVIVMMRCPKGEEAKCAQLRSEIIQKVLQVRDEHCKAVRMSESFIHPNDVKYPFIDNAEDFKCYSLTEIARATVKDAPNVLDYGGRNPFPMKDLLLFDPYCDTSTELLSELFSERHSLDEQVRGGVLRMLPEGEAGLKDSCK